MSETVNAINASNESIGQDKRALLARLLKQKANKPKYFPPSFGQQRLWLLHQFEPLGPLYHMVASVRLRGELDLSALKQAFTEITRRHESLRTTFADINGEPMQVVHPAKAFDLQLVDLVALPAELRKTEARRAVSESSEVPFDLTTGPLLRAMLVRLEKGDHILLLNMHHIVSDGWSVNVLAHEVGVLYHAFSKGLRSPLPELPIQYSDFSRWQRERMGGEVLEEHIEYWRKHLEGELPLLELPTDRPRGAVRSLAGSTCGIVIPKVLSEQLRALSRSERVTMFMLMLTAFKTLLYRYSGQPDIIIGTPVAGRERIETESLIGFFINMVAMRSDLSDNPSFRELLSRIKEVALGAYAHQEMPFDRVVDELQVNRSFSHTPVFQVVFDLRTVAQNNEQEKATKLEGLKWNTIESDVPTARFDLTLNLNDTAEGITGSVEYRTDIFDAATIQRLVSHFHNLLAAICADPDARLQEFSLLSPEESRRLLHDFNPQVPALPPAVCLHQLFEKHAENSPDSRAISFDGFHLSYGKVNARANRLAHHLRSLGVGPEDRVAVLLDRTPDLVIAILGILKAGAAYLPLDPAYPQERLAYMLVDAGAQVVVTEQALVDRWLLDQPQVTLVCLDDEQVLATASNTNLSAEEVGVRAENAAYVIYTSGSTGQPKGVVVTHENVWRLLEVTRGDFEFDETDVWTLFHSVCFDFSVWELWGPLSHGGRLVVVPYWVSREPSAFYELLKEEKVTVLNQTPSAFRQLLKVDEALSKNGDLPLLVVVFGGEALEMSMLRGWFERHGDKQPRLVNMYGITETTVHVTYRELAARDTEGGSVIGDALGDLEVYVLDQQMRAVPEGVSGELYVGGGGVARGYLGRAELTAQRFVPHPYSERPGARLYRTGDLARRRADGELEYLGRIDDQVKIRGFRIELGEIANALREQAGVRECVVLALGEGGEEKKIVAYVVANKGVNSGELREELKKQLPEHMIPSAIVMLDAMPLTRNGKVDRNALPEPNSVIAETEFVAPRSIVEQGLAEIWASLLCIDRISVHDNFFAAGGHSLLATKMISRVREAFQVEMSPRALYEAPTVAGLAEVIELAIRSGRGLEVPPFERVSREEKLPLSFAQQRLWFLYQLEPDSPAYNVPVSVRLQGSLDINALEQSLNEILSRHEVLRTTFSTVDGEAVQVISPAQPLNLQAIDVNWLSAESSLDDEARKLATVETQQVFDLGNGPLLRVKLFRFKEDDHVLILTMHHIVSDGWSVGILINEVATLYKSFTEGQPSSLTELPIQYADFAHWQRQWLDGEILSKQIEYWKQQLTGAAPLELPTDRPRPPVLSYRGAVETLLLERNLVESLRELSQRQGVTFFMLMLAAFKVFLMRYTEQQDISVGTPISGRNWMEIEGLIGFFVNTLVLRTEVHAQESFEEVVRRVREVALDGYAHQDVPFEKLVAEIQPERDSSRQPLFQVAFSMRNANSTSEGVESSGLQLSPIAGENRTAKFDLNFLLTETGGTIDAALEYNTDLFDSKTVERMLQHFRSLLAGIVNNPKQAVSTLPLLGDDERLLILEDWNDTASSFPSDLALHQLFEAQVDRAPEATALIFGDESLSYSELDERANALARYLRRLGVTDEQPVGICLPRSTDMFVALLAVLKAGGVYVPLDADYPLARLRLMAEDTRLKVVITNSELSGTLTGIEARMVQLDTDAEVIAAEGRTRLETAELLGSERLAYIIYTSGSTGQPKGVAVPQSAIARLVFNTNYVQLNASDRIAQASNASFDAMTFEVWGALLHGACLVGVAKDIALSPQEFSAQLREQRITTIFLTTALFNQIASTVPDAFATLRQVLFGGEAVDPKWVREVLEKGSPERLLHVYGPTESTTFALWHQVTNVEEKATTIPIGKPLSNTEAYVLDQNLQPVPVGAHGELYLGGDGLARDYYNCPDTTAEKFIPHPFSNIPGARLYKTGDLVRYLPDGNIQFIGRIDHQVKVRGFRIELSEIEAVLDQHPDVQECTVLAREDSPGERRLVAYLVSGDASALTANELRLYLQEKLPDYMIPTSFVRLDALPLTRNGKVDRNALPSPEHEQMEMVGEYVAPRNSLEEVLAEIWIEVLKLERVGIHDNFFTELGGHSLLATQMVTRVRNAFEVNLPLRRAFEAPTIADLAMAIETIILDEVEELMEHEVQGQVHEAH